MDAGLPVNVTNAKDDSLLILASYYNHPETVAALLHRNADPGRLNDRGQTVLAAATFRQSVPIVTMLLETGADPHAGGPTAIEMAQFFDLPATPVLL